MSVVSSLHFSSELVRGSIHDQSANSLPNLGLYWARGSATLSWADGGVVNLNRSLLRAWTKPQPPQLLPHYMPSKQPLVLRWSDSISWCLTGPALGSIYFIISKLSWLMIFLGVKTLNLTRENLLWWAWGTYKMFCGLWLGNHISTVFDMGAMGKMKIIQHGLVLCFAWGLQSECSSLEIHLLYPL